MFKWRLLVAGCSVSLFVWGLFAFVDYSRSVGGTGDPYAGWVFSGLGLVGLATLAWSRFGYVAAVAQFAAAAYAAWWCVLAFAFLQAGAIPNSGLQFLGPLILSIALPALVLCGANVIGTWQVARRTPHSV